ncbi:MAG: TetR family transcriptional regulator C-terminal domain-containing protein [Gaiellaceae bacterium]
MHTFPIAAPHESEPPLEQQHSARQAQLIRSTYRLIAERGVHRASLREIAQGAGMSKGLIPYYFKTKENLILATMRWALSETANRIKRAMAAASTPEEKIVAMVDAIFVEPEANRRFQVAYLDLVGYAARVRTYMELSATFDGIVNSLNADVIRLGAAQGAFTIDDVDETAIALRALVDGLFLQWLQEADWRGEHARYRDVCKRAALQLLGARRSAGPPRTKAPAELLPLTKLEQVHGSATHA